MEQIVNRLKAMQDLKYKEFHCKLMPTVETERVIGVRVPQLRKYAKEIKDSQLAEEFLQELPHQYYEENNLHGFLLSEIKDYNVCIEKLNAFLPYMDNWATCDSTSPKIFKKHRSELLQQIKVWMASEHSYTVRFGIGMLMQHFLDEDFNEDYLEWVAKIRSEEYYINMMIAWYFATALAKQYDAALPYIQEQRLAPWVHNKTIQKAVESYRVTQEHKEYLKTLKIKKK